MLNKIIMTDGLRVRFQALIDSLTSDMSAFTIQVRGLMYDVYHAMHPLKGTPLSIALRTRLEDGRSEVAVVAEGRLNARDIAPRIIEAQKKELA